MMRTVWSLTGRVADNWAEKMNATDESARGSGAVITSRAGSLP